ncbi:MAG: hypothetical protein U0U70_11135 [Chitinophagaceae bacterium]
MKLKVVSIISILIVFFSYKKERDEHYWETVDGPSFGKVAFPPPLCDISKKEAEEKYTNYWFHLVGTDTNCYWIQFSGSIYYFTNMAEEFVQEHSQLYKAYQYTKIDCVSFCNVT